MNSKKKAELTYYVDVEPRRKDSFWFDGHVASITDGKTEVRIVAMGHVDVIFNVNENSFNNNSARKEARNRGYTDQKLKNLNRHDGWLNNNWYAFEIVKDGKEEIDDYTDVYLPDAIDYAKQLLKDS